MSNLSITTNLFALNSHRSLKVVSAQKEKASARLSSGYKINSAADDAAGLAISEKMRAQIRGLDMATQNTQDGISLIQTAEGALTEVCSMIHRIRELTVKGANDVYEQEDRDKIADEIFQLTNEIWKTEDRVEFNNMKILKTFNDINGEVNEQSIDGKYLQIGPNSDQSMVIDLDLKASMVGCPYDLDKVSFLYAIHSMLNHSGLSLKGLKGDNHIAGTSYNYTGDDDPTDLTYEMNHSITGKTQTEWISYMIGNVDAAMGYVTTVRSKLGAIQNRLEHTMRSLEISSENLSASESRIRDADMAGEMMSLTQANVLQQASVSMLAQANQAPNNVLQLLQQ